MRWRQLSLCLALLGMGCWLSTISVRGTSALADDSAPSTPDGHKTQTETAVTQRFEQNGLSIEWSLLPLEGQESHSAPLVGQAMIAQVRITDPRSGKPVLGIRPRAWMSRRASDMVADEIACVDKVRRLASGRLGTRAEIDLNRYVVLAMNHDRTISVIDPFLNFQITKLENLVTLPGVGLDWALSHDHTTVYVTMPDVGAVGLIDTRTRKLLRTVDMGQGSRPGRLLVQPDGRYVWVGLDGIGKLGVLDAATHELVSTIPVEGGMHTLIATPDSRFVYTTNSQADTLSAIDSKSLSRVASIPVASTPVTLAYSDVARRLYVGSVNGTAISIIDPFRHELVGQATVTPGVVALATDPSGRFIFGVNQLESQVFVLDAATNQLMASASVTTDPDQIVFTDRFAYVRGIGSEKFTILDLREARNGRLAPLDIQAGRLTPSQAPRELGPAAMIVPTPQGDGVIIANAPDATLHVYQEGMMAPMGSFSNYARMPRGIMILDRSLKETVPGIYQAPVTFTKAGGYDIPLLIDQPRTFHCFQTTVRELTTGVSIAAAPRPPIVRSDFGSEPIPVRVPTVLTFALIDAATQQPISGLRDVQVLVFEPPGSWQQRHHAREVEPGRYTVTQSFPRAGEYRVMVQTLSQHLRYADGVPVVQHVMSSSSQSTKQMQRAEGRRP